MVIDLTGEGESVATVLPDSYLGLNKPTILPSWNKSFITLACIFLKEESLPKAPNNPSTFVEELSLDL